MKNSKVIAVTLVALLGLSACSGAEIGDREAGALGGGALGAGLGAIIGNQVGSTGAGLAIGGAAGALSGALIGNETQKAKTDRAAQDERMRRQEEDLQRQRREIEELRRDQKSY